MTSALRPALWFSLFLTLYLAGRVLGPNDLNTKDQPKTVAYTVDMLDNGRWLWPRDMRGEPATKPPLYNWMAALPIALTGIYHTFTFKLPSLLAGLGCLGFLALFVRHLSRLALPQPIPFSPVFWLAAFAWLANFTVYGLIYTARPDMLLAVFLCGGWTLGTLLLDDSPIFRRKALWSGALWLCLLGAILTKGTPALLLILYLPLYALIRHRSLRPLLRTHAHLGLPAVALLTFLLFQVTWQGLPESHREFLFRSEASRITGGGFLEGLQSLYKMPQYFLVRFVPWSLVFLGLFLRVDRGNPGAFPWAPVYIWFLLVLVFFSVPNFKRDDYLLPAYPVCALAAGYATWTLLPRLRHAIVALAAILMAGSVADDVFTKEHLRPRYAGNCARFAQTVRATLPPGADPVFLQTGYNNLQAHLGRNRPLAESRVDSLRPGDYLLRPVYLLREDQAIAYRLHGPELPSYEAIPPIPGLELELLHLSAPVAQVSGNRPGLIGLYRVRNAP